MDMRSPSQGQSYSTETATTPSTIAVTTPSRIVPRKYVGVSLLQNYELQERLGAGTFGVVHKAVRKGTQQVYALKELKLKDAEDGLPITAIREIKILKRLQSAEKKGIIALHEIACGSTGDNINLVFEYYDFDLSRILPVEFGNEFPLPNVKHYMKQLLEALHTIHSAKLMHRDIKSANILVDRKGNLRLADFGLARNIIAEDEKQHQKYTPTVCTLWYRPPELLLGELRYNASIDMWGAGCILAELLERTALFKSKHEDKPEGQIQQLLDIFAVCGTPDEKDWPKVTQLPQYKNVQFKEMPRVIKTRFEKFGTKVADLIDKLLQLNPENRLTATNALDHEWFWEAKDVPDLTKMDYKDPRTQARGNEGPPALVVQRGNYDYVPYAANNNTNGPPFSRSNQSRPYNSQQHQQHQQHQYHSRPSSHHQHPPPPPLLPPQQHYFPPPNRGGGYTMVGGIGGRPAYQPLPQPQPYMNFQQPPPPPPQQQQSQRRERESSTDSASKRQRTDNNVVPQQQQSHGNMVVPGFHAPLPPSSRPRLSLPQQGQMPNRPRPPPARPNQYPPNPYSKTH